MKRMLSNTCLLFAILCILFIPYPFYLFPFQDSIAGYLSGELLTLLSGTLNGHAAPAVTSDSGSMYLLLSLILVTAIALSPVMNRLNDKQYVCLVSLAKSVSAIYLALHLAKYGMEKLLKTQFYLPEPNILYTPFGMLDQDILYWSTIGTSHPYNVFLGIAEVTAALLLLFKRTRIAGALFAWVLMINIVLVNFSFNISVKLFSLFLTYLCVLLLFPHAKSFYAFLILGRKSRLTATDAERFSLIRHPFWLGTAKAALVCLLVVESAWPYIMQSQVNDDDAARPFLHGAYRVMQVNGTAPAGFIRFEEVKRLFIHRRGYLIFQYHNDLMQDYKLRVNGPGLLTLTGYQREQVQLQYTYVEKDSVLELKHVTGSGEYMLKARALNWKAMPALQSRFRWTSDPY